MHSVIAPKIARTTADPRIAGQRRVDHRGSLARFGSACALLCITLLPLSATSAPAVPPIVMAAAKGDTAAVRTLLRQGASPNTHDDQGISALEWASAKGHLATVLALLNAHAMVDGAYNPMKYTPLMRSANFGFANIAAILIAHGANVNAHDAIGETPMDFALDSNHKDVIAVLTHHGAKLSATLFPSMFCHAGSSSGFGNSALWTPFANNRTSYYCQSVKHEFGGSTGDVIMYTYQVGGTKALARTIYINTDIFMATIPNDLIAKTLRPLLAAIYSNSHRGVMPPDVLANILSFDKVRSNTKLGYVRGDYKAGDHPDHPTIGASYTIRITLH